MKVGLRRNLPTFQPDRWSAYSAMAESSEPYRRTQFRRGPSTALRTMELCFTSLRMTGLVVGLQYAKEVDEVLLLLLGELDVEALVVEVDNFRECLRLAV